MTGLSDAALLAAVDWTPVIVAAFTLAGVLANIFAAVYIAVHVRTPSGTRIGAQVENATHLAISNRHLLVRLARELGLRADDPQLRAAMEDDGAA